MNTLMEQAIEALFEGKLDDNGTLEGKVLADFWRGIKIEIESALRDYARFKYIQTHFKMGLPEDA